MKRRSEGCAAFFALDGPDGLCSNVSRLPLSI